MRKTIILASVLLTALASCGPHRLQCGPGRRCDVQIKSNPHTLEPIQKNANT